MDSFKIFGLIVLFNPEDLDFVLKNIRILNSLNVEVVIFDNSFSSNLENNRNVLLKEFPNLNFASSNGENYGLSYAFNQVINTLNLNNEIDGLIFFDQDSKITLESIANLISSYRLLIKKSDFGLLAGLPIFKDEIKYRIRPVNIKFTTDSIIEVYQVSSSFSLIPFKTLNKIGQFQNDFFIDYIDMEYCLRCRKNGLKIFIDQSAPYQHEIGLGNVYLFGYFLFPYGHPFRHYYQVRNLLIALNRNNISKIVIIREILIRFLVIIITGLIVGEGSQRIKFFVKGLMDGINGKMGKL